MKRTEHRTQNGKPKYVHYAHILSIEEECVRHSEGKSLIRHNAIYENGTHTVCDIPGITIAYIFEERTTTKITAATY